MKTIGPERDRFYRSFFSLSLVLVFQNVLALSVNLADNIMLGGFSETALSGATAVNQIQFLFQQMLSAIGDGAVILGSQYRGAKKDGPIRKIAVISLRFGIGIALLLFTAVSLFPRQAILLFTSDEAIIREGISYLAIIRFTYLLFAVTTLLLATLRIMEIVKIAFCLSVSTLIINCGINYILIYGRFGAPALGIRGAAVGTLTARVVECAVVIWYVLKKEQVLKLRLSDFLSTDRQLRSDYLKLTLPMFFVQSLWGLNTAIQTMILGHMTARAIAANSAASNLYLLVKSSAVGSSSAAAVLIGKTVGTGNMALVKEYSRRLQKLFVLTGILSGILLFFIRIPVLSLYDLSPETRELANRFLIILSVVCVTMSYQMPTNTGIIRGGGSPSFVVRVDLISIWGIVLPISFFMAFVVKASPEVVVCCLNADQVFKCIPAFIKVNYGHWARNLTRNSS